MTLPPSPPCAEIAIGPLRVGAEPVDIEACAAALGLPYRAGWVPLTFPIRWQALPEVRAAITRVAGECPIHATQSFNYSGTIEPGQAHQLWIGVHRETGSPSRIAVRGTVVDAGNRVVVETQSLLHSTGTKIPAATSKGSALGVSGLPRVEIASIDASQVARYAAAMQDANPLHLDPRRARAAGFDGPIVHGMLVMGMLERAVSTWCGGARLRRLHAMFTQPVAVGSGLAIAGHILPTRNGRGDCIVRCFVRTDRGTVVCVGEASLSHDQSPPLPTL